jgi:hypothetical protein
MCSTRENSLQGQGDGNGTIDGAALRDREARMEQGWIRVSPRSKSGGKQVGRVRKKKSASVS